MALLYAQGWGHQRFGTVLLVFCHSKILRGWIILVITIRYWLEYLMGPIVREGSFWVLVPGWRWGFAWNTVRDVDNFVFPLRSASINSITPQTSLSLHSSLFSAQISTQSEESAQKRGALSNYTAFFDRSIVWLHSFNAQGRQTNIQESKSNRVWNNIIFSWVTSSSSRLLWYDSADQPR